ncbi:hypothetical protein FA95DRAFT_1564219 [Auriscalpium vulgare]|uniref:Uncharacterized protein n=1 Tax=Auriscalpium vulgare TaxID=40419 RepID=A0ACB8RG36_9AGAM|nr:hypothetical protein FA95DRAFT_1564219 [Auriscalpium vulgare]
MSLQRLLAHSLCIRSLRHAPRVGVLSACRVFSLSPSHLRRSRPLSTAASASPPFDTSASTAPSTSQSTPDSTTDTNVLYSGPLTKTFRHLKLFSLTSLGLSCTLTPFLFVIPSGLPFSARAALAITALGTSGISTALVAWCGRPYVTAIRRLPAAPTPTPTPTTPINGAPPTHPAPSHNDYAPAGVELQTLTLALRPLATRVYDPVFLADTERPFAKWELAGAVQLPAEDVGSVEEGEEETVAETIDRQGEVVGRWIVRWGKDGDGFCRGEGDVVRYFNVHEELLETPIR